MTRVTNEEKSLISENFALYKIFKNLFLPQGYPDSVSEDYIRYQFWDTIQAFCSTINGTLYFGTNSWIHFELILNSVAIVGTLSTHAILKGVGVGSEYVNPLSATITWVS